MQCRKCVSVGGQRALTQGWEDSWEGKFQSWGFPTSGGENESQSWRVSARTAALGRQWLGGAWLKGLSGLGRGLAGRSGAGLVAAAAGESDEGGRNRSGNPLGQDQLSGSHSCSHLPLSLSLPSSHFLFPLPFAPHPRHFRGKRLRWGVLPPPPAHSRHTCLQPEEGKAGLRGSQRGQHQKSPPPGAKVSHRYSTWSSHSLGQRSAIGISHGVPKILALGLRADDLGTEDTQDKRPGVTPLLPTGSLCQRSPRIMTLAFP